MLALNFSTSIFGCGIIESTINVLADKITKP